MNQLFSISHLTTGEAEKIAASPNDPHDHDYEELIVCREGDFEHFIDFRSEKFTAPFISFVTRGKIHRIKPIIKNNVFSLWVIAFKGEFIPETTFQLYSTYHNYANLQLSAGENFDRLDALCKMMYDESKKEIPDFAVIRLLLSTLFTMIESERKKISDNEDVLLSTQNITFKNFLKILEENFRRPEGVDYYAEKLFMTTRNLNLICNNILHKSVSEIIETRKLIEAKNLLLSTDKTVSEIGFELGYNEKAYFTTVFKKKTGQTPTEFRSEMNRLIS